MSTVAIESPKRERMAWRRNLSFGYIGVLYIWALIVVIFAIWSPSQFLEATTLRQIVDQYSIPALAALAVVLPMAAGTFDASIAGNISLSGVLCAYVIIHTGLPIWVAILIAIGSGLVLGIVNAIIVVFMGIPSLIGTLATWLIADSLSVAIANNTAYIYSDRTEGPLNRYVHSLSWSGFNIPIVYVAVIAVIMGIVLSRTVSGRYTYAVGFNIASSKLAGIRVRAVQSLAFIASGVIGAIAGVVLTAQLGLGAQGVGDTYLLPAFAAVFVGATQFKAKRFNVTGTIIAVFMLGTGEFGLNAVGAPQWTAGVFQGVALISAIGLTHLYDPSRSSKATRRANAAATVLTAPIEVDAAPVAPPEVQPEVTVAVAAGASHNGAASVHVAPTIEIAKLSKTFPGQRALIDVDAEVLPGEIHALLGQNGSGKSTLIKILAGIYTPDPGSHVRVCGQELTFGSPRDARSLGLKFVHQTLGIVEELTAVENIALGFGYVRQAGPFINWPAQRRKTRRLLAKLSIDFDINVPVSQLKPVERSALAIARALDDDDGPPKVLVLDEPTAALPPHEVEALFKLVREARSDGTSVIYVSHRMNEVFQLADRMTVLRDGVSQGTFNTRDVDHAALVHLIVGDNEEAAAALHAQQPAPTVAPVREVANVDRERIALKVRGLSAQRLDEVAFDLKPGEILGVAGLTGSGREEFAGALVGARPSRVELVVADGRRRVNPSPRQAKALGVVLVLPNRDAAAAILQFSIRENISLPSLHRDAKNGFVQRSSEDEHAARWLAGLDIRPRDPERLYALLSGGNQQKVVFAKWLSFAADVMVIEDPTSGVDVGARQAIYDLVRQQAAAGISFVVCSSDHEDLLAVCDRILVLHEGHVVEELTGTSIEEARLLMSMEVAERDSPVEGTLERVGE